MHLIIISSRLGRSLLCYVFPHIAEHCPFRLRVEQFHVIIYPVFLSLHHPSHISISPTVTLQMLLMSKPSQSALPYHLSCTLNTQKTVQVYMTSLCFLSFDTPHIHLTIIRSALSRLQILGLNSLPTFEYHMPTHRTRALYIFSFMRYDKEYRGGNSTTAEEVFRFQRLISNPSWLVWERASRHQNSLQHSQS